MSQHILPYSLTTRRYRCKIFRVTTNLFNFAVVLLRVSTALLPIILRSYSASL